MDTVRAGGEDREADDADEEVQARGGEAAPGPEEGAGEEDPEGLQREGHVLVDGHVELPDLDGRHGEGDVGADDEEEGARRDEGRIASGGWRALDEDGGDEPVGQGALGQAARSPDPARLPGHAHGRGW